MEQLVTYRDEVLNAVRSVDLNSVEAVVSRLESAYAENQLVCVIGNGGSAANASHFAEDLCKGTMLDSKAKRFRVISLTDNTSFITAIANDIGYENIFTFQLCQFARSGDLLVSISGSGNSPNVIEAVEYARANDIFTIGFTGFDGGKLRKLSDLNVHVPVLDMGQTEAVHSVLFHMITDMIKARFAAAGCS